MKAWTCVDHDCQWPVGVASVIVAADEAEARRLLIGALKARGLPGNDDFTLQELDLTTAHAVVLRDGEY